jgi:hypothetical protein
VTSQPFSPRHYRKRGHQEKEKSGSSREWMSDITLTPDVKQAGSIGDRRPRSCRQAKRGQRIDTSLPLIEDAEVDSKVRGGWVVCERASTISFDTKTHAPINCVTVRRPAKAIDH